MRRNDQQVYQSSQIIFHLNEKEGPVPLFFTELNAC